MSSARSTPSSATRRPALARCPNCRALPQFRPSDDRHYRTLLVHSAATCPAAYGLVAYHHSRAQAAAVWNRHAAAHQQRREA